ncbi:MAG: S-methyl-5-thioribose-1-phosphate isomerase [Pseudomonadales bacterium]|nr:S-methyl-5-thioribose-1-phosphate isomerase [Pseudomonadales bacterium]
MTTLPISVSWQADTVRILDQRLLPGREEYLDCRDVEQVFTAIKTLSVRGAPAIGIAAAYGLVVGLSAAAKVGSSEHLMKALKERRDYLASARPTAVNLVWALDRMMSVANSFEDIGAEKLIQCLIQEAETIHTEDKASCRAIGEAGYEVVKRHPRLLTHCNAGSLAVSELGTALAPMYVAHQRGIELHVFVDETRPLLQGARLTAFELGRAGINRTLITDNMAAHVMSEGKVDAVIVGADRVVANGDAANKIGTMNLAILCQHFKLPFYIACPWSTVDLSTQKGDEILIEERGSEEITQIDGHLTAEQNTPVYNPAFDVTPHALITGYITDRGLLTAKDLLDH